MKMQPPVTVRPHALSTATVQGHRNQRCRGLTAMDCHSDLPTAFHNYHQTSSLTSAKLSQRTRYYFHTATHWLRTPLLPRAAQLSYLSLARRRAAVAGPSLGAQLQHHNMYTTTMPTSERLFWRRRLDSAARAVCDRLRLRCSHVPKKA